MILITVHFPHGVSYVFKSNNLTISDYVNPDTGYIVPKFVDYLMTYTNLGKNHNREDIQLAMIGINNIDDIPVIYE
jgi:hypothetical protein